MRVEPQRGFVSSRTGGVVGGAHSVEEVEVGADGAHALPWRASEEGRERRGGPFSMLWQRQASLKRAAPLHKQSLSKRTGHDCVQGGLPRWLNRELQSRVERLKEPGG